MLIYLFFKLYKLLLHMLFHCGFYTVNGVGGSFRILGKIVIYVRIYCC